MDWEYEDLRYMERSTLREFVDPGQLAVLLLLWQRADRADDAAFRDRDETLPESEDD